MNYRKRPKPVIPNLSQLATDEHPGGANRAPQPKQGMKYSPWSSHRASVSFCRQFLQCKVMEKGLRVCLHRSKSTGFVNLVNGKKLRRFAIGDRGLVSWHVMC